MRIWIKVAIICLTLAAPFPLRAELRIGLASRSSVKKAALEEAFRFVFPNETFSISQVDGFSEVPEQPKGSEEGTLGARNRLKNAKLMTPVALDYWVSIENYIDQTEKGNWQDIGAVLVEKQGRTPHLALTPAVEFPSRFALLSQATGFTRSAGDFLAKETGLPGNDWHARYGGQSRQALLRKAIIRGLIASEIDLVQNFPKANVAFRDISPLLANPALFSATIRLMAEEVGSDVDMIAGAESRGFVFGAPLAMILGKPFVMIRKKGKLPRPTHSVTYEKEYGADTLEIQSPDLSGKRVLIVDDLLATGGTMRASEELFERAGVSKVSSLCLIALLHFQGQSQLKSSTQSLIQF